MRSKLKVAIWVQHSVDSLPFYSTSIRHPRPELRLFQNLTLKIKGQGHGWGHSSKSQCGSKILSTHIPFVPCQSASYSWDTAFSKFDLENLRVKVKWSLCYTTAGLDNSIEVTSLNSINPSGSFRDMGSAKSGKSAACFDTFFAHGKPIWGK